MSLTRTSQQRGDLEQAAAHARQTRTWKRDRALLLLGDGLGYAHVAQTLGCGQSTVSRWVAIWRAQGVTRLAEGQHLGRTRRLDAGADARLQALLGSDPQTHGHHTTGWTVPRPRTSRSQPGAKSGWPTRPRCASSRHCARAGAGWGIRRW